MSQLCWDICRLRNTRSKCRTNGCINIEIEAAVDLWDFQCSLRIRMVSKLTVNVTSACILNRDPCLSRFYDFSLPLSRLISFPRCWQWLRSFNHFADTPPPPPIMFHIGAKIKQKWDQDEGRGCLLPILVDWCIGCLDSLLIETRGTYVCWCSSLHVSSIFHRISWFSCWQPLSTRNLKTFVIIHTLATIDLIWHKAGQSTIGSSFWYHVRTMCLQPLSWSHLLATWEAHGDFFSPLTNLLDCSADLEDKFHEAEPTFWTGVMVNRLWYQVIEVIVIMGAEPRVMYRTTYYV